jgi:hypothetical protein
VPKPANASQDLTHGSWLLEECQPLLILVERHDSAIYWRTVDGRGKQRLNLAELGDGCPALTPATGLSLCEAASVCLARRHESGVTLHVTGDHQETYETHWPVISEQMRRTHHDEQMATERGAYGVAILLVKRASELTVVLQSRKGTGFDYWLGTDDQLFQNAARLEVSGVLQAKDGSAVRRRAKRKERQTSVSDEMGLPAVVVVVEFGQPAAQYSVRK